jgi:hypothetical protein
MASSEVVTGFEKIENELNLIYLLFHQQDIYEHVIFVSYTTLSPLMNAINARHHTISSQSILMDAAKHLMKLKATSLILGRYTSIDGPLHEAPWISSENSPYIS